MTATFNGSLIDQLDITLCIQTKNQEDEDFFVFMNMKKPDFDRFVKDNEDPNLMLDLSTYGTVICYNMGIATEELKQSIANIFGYDLNTTEIKNPVNYGV